MVDPAQAGSLELSYSEAAHVPPHLWTPSSIRAAGSGETAKLPLDGNAYHWSLQWQRNEALRAKVSLLWLALQLSVSRDSSQAASGPLVPARLQSFPWTAMPATAACSGSATKPYEPR